MARVVRRIPITLGDPEFFCNKSWTVSFNLNTKSWISFHSYLPNWYIGENNFFYSGLNDCCTDFDFIAGELPSNIDCNLWGYALCEGYVIDCDLDGECVDCTPTPTTTSTTSTTTTTVTTLYPPCELDGEVIEIDVTTTTTSSSTTACVRPDGLSLITLVTGYTFDGINIDSTTDKVTACDVMHYLMETPDPGIEIEYLYAYGYGTSLGEFLYASNGTDDCSCIPDGWYFTDESASYDYVFHVVNCVVVGVYTCGTTTTTTSSSTTIEPYDCELDGYSYFTEPDDCALDGNAIPVDTTTTTSTSTTTTSTTLCPIDAYLLSVDCPTTTTTSSTSTTSTTTSTTSSTTTTTTTSSTTTTTSSTSTTTTTSSSSSTTTTSSTSTTTSSTTTTSTSSTTTTSSTSTTTTSTTIECYLVIELVSPTTTTTTSSSSTTTTTTTHSMCEDCDLYFDVTTTTSTTYEPLVMIGGYDSYGNSLFKTDDGSTFEGYGDPYGAGVTMLDKCGNRWFICGYNESDQYTFGYSDNGGATWNTITSINSLFNLPTGYVQSVAYNGSVYVAMGDNNSINTMAYSYDGINWNGLGKTIFSELGRVVFWDGSKFIAGGRGTNVLAYSADGINWTGLGYTTELYLVGDITYNGDSENPIYVAVGNGTGVSNTIMYSTDGLDWYGAGKPVFQNAGYGVTFAEGKFMACGYKKTSVPTDGIVGSSTDGSNWTNLGDEETIKYASAITYVNGTFIIVGNGWDNGGYPIIYSTDGGTSWTRCSSGLGDDCYDIAPKNTHLGTQ